MNYKVFLIILSGNIGMSYTYEQCHWTFRPNLEDCDSYYQCNHGEALLRFCSPGLHWNALHNTCDWPTRANCIVQLAPGGESNEVIQIDPFDREEECDAATQPFAPNPSDCSKYFVCDHGALVGMSCSPPLHWNPTHNACDWPANAGCTPTTDSKPPVSISMTTTTTSSTEAPIGPPTTSGTTTEKPPTTTSGPPASTVVGILIPTDDSGSTAGPPAPPPYDPLSSNHQNYKYKVICYFTGWSVYRQGTGKFTPAEIDETLCTHIVYAFATLDTSTWTIKISDPWMDIDNGFYTKVTELKKKGLVVTIGMGGWNDSEGQRYSLLLADPSKQSAFITSVVAFIKKHNFDGIDLDYEYPGCPQGNCNEAFSTDKNGFAALVIGLRGALPKGAVISAAVSANKNIIQQGYEVGTLSEYLDWIGVMTYDIHGAWEKETGHIAPLYPTPKDKISFLNCDSAISEWIEKGASPSKIIMGLPLYGQSFTLASASENGLFAPTRGPGVAGRYTRQGGILSYYEICSANWTSTVQDAQGLMGPYSFQGDQWVSYDDVSFLKTKTNYIMSRGLGGAMVWALDFDDFTNVCGGGKYPLLRAVKNSLIPLARKKEVREDPYHAPQVSKSRSHPFTLSHFFI